MVVKRLVALLAEGVVHLLGAVCAEPVVDGLVLEANHLLCVQLRKQAALAAEADQVSLRRLNEEGSPYRMIVLTHRFNTFVSLDQTLALRTSHRSHRLEALVTIRHVLHRMNLSAKRYLLHAERLAQEALLAIHAHKALRMETLVSHLYFRGIDFHMTVVAQGRHSTALSYLNWRCSVSQSGAFHPPF